MRLMRYCNIVKTPSVTGINSYISVTQSSVSLFVVQYISVRNRMMKYTTKDDTIKVRKVDSLIPSSCKDGVTGPCRSGKVPCHHSPSQGVNYHQEVFFSQWTSLTFLVNAHRWLLWQPEDAVMQLEDYQRAVSSLRTCNILQLFGVVVVATKVNSETL